MSTSRRRFPSAKAIAAAAAAASSSQRPTSKKGKKPKFLSLKLQLNPEPSLENQTLASIMEESKPIKKMKTTNKKKGRIEMAGGGGAQRQLNLFPLCPEAENVCGGGGGGGGGDDQQRRIRDEIHDDHVAILLETDAADTSTSLHGLLDSTATTTTTISGEDPVSTSHSIFQGIGEAAQFDPWMVRAAMRCRERDASEERWVSYCEVVEECPKKKKKVMKKKKKRFEQDEVNSGAGDFLVPTGFVGGDGADFDPLGAVLNEQQTESNNGLPAVVGLKLDYQEILDAWSDKGSLYIDGGESPPQTVPDLHDTSPPPSGSMEACGNLWRVPEMEENGGEREWKLGQREASVLRYKEKRQNRLFAKRIRYEVRKLNAEKRPRLKGRFVKRIGES